MKRVLLLGDSIRMGYQAYVREQLAGEYEVVYDEMDNGRFAAYTLWHATQMFRRFGSFDLVHWNNGYWDMNTEAPMPGPLHPLEEYLHYLRRIIGLVRETGAKLIFATTTPILDRDKPGYRADTAFPIGYDNAWVAQYNDAAKLLMAQERVPVNDLYSLCMQDPECYKCPDMLHLTEAGYRACAAQVADHVRRLLG